MILIEIVKGNPIFPNDKHKTQYSYLNKNIKTETLIIGGGVTGALALWYFSQKGIPCVLIDANRFGMGSTSITTSLLQYELDDNFNTLSKTITEKQVEKCYKLGVDALGELSKIIKRLGNNCSYKKNNCFLFTQNIFEKKDIENEYKARKNMKLDVRFLEDNDTVLPFKFKSGIFSKNGGARLNPYNFTHQLLNDSKKYKARLYENTKAVSISYSDSFAKVYTEYNNYIIAKNVVVATGYNISTFTKKEFCKKYVTYNIVTKPIKNLKDLNLLVRDNKTIYHYFRQTDDGRIILGGADTPLAKNGIDKSIAQIKYKSLLKYLKDLFPGFSKYIEIDMGYCGIFATTKDNMGVIGVDKKHKQLSYCLGYGANGILFSIMGAKMLAEQYVGNIQKDLDIFSPNRDSL